MCGISGIAFSDPRRVPEQALLEGMGRLVAHRGPDGQGSLLAPGIGLDFRRLAIIDPETGHQPLFNEDRSVVLVCNGEIYNYLELRRELTQRGHVFATGSDAEVAVHLYEESGPQFLHRLRGMFGLALWDQEKRSLMLARDRLGIKPMHYWCGPQGDLVFASEIKSILASGMVERAVEPRALCDLLSLGFVVTPRTMFKGIAQLEAGQMLLYSAGEHALHRYWDLDFQPLSPDDGRKTCRDWSEELLAVLQETTALHLRSDVPVGAWLSPGLDSSTIASLVIEARQDPLLTYTLTYEEKGAADEGVRCSTLDQFHPERIRSRRVSCGNADLQHFPRNLWHRESPTSSTLNLAQMLLSEAASRRVKVVLTGEGADEDLGGYPWYHADRLFRPFSLLPCGLRGLMTAWCGLVPRYAWVQRMFAAPRDDRERYRLMIGLSGAGPHGGLLHGDFRENCQEGDLRLLPHLPESFADWHPFQRMQYIETKTRLTDLITHGLDRASMSHSLEVRVPFLDHELVELCARIPVGCKMKGLTEKYVLRRAMQDRLPREIAWRRKCAFAPADRAWLGGELPGYARDLLSRPRIMEKGYFEPDRVDALLAAHRQGRADNARFLAVVLGVQIWDELFLKDFAGSAYRWGRADS